MLSWRSYGLLCCQQGDTRWHKVDSLDRDWVRTGAGLEIFASSGTPLAVVPVPRGSLELYRLLRVGSAYMFVQSKLFRIDV